MLRVIIFISLVATTLVTADKEDKHSHDNDVGYKFGYGVHDPHTHDFKSHHEERHGKDVLGYYTVKDPDGTTRIVHYKAGPHTGFEAFVEVIGKPHYGKEDDHDHEKKDHHGHEEEEHHHNHHGHHHDEDKKGHHDGHHGHEEKDHHDDHHDDHHGHEKKNHDSGGDGHGYEVHEDHEELKKDFFDFLDW